MLAQYAPPSIIVGHDENVLHMSDRAGRFLQYPGGELSRDVNFLVLPPLRLELRTALLKAKKTNLAVEGSSVLIQRDGKMYSVVISVRPFRDDDAGADLLLVLFGESEATLDPAAQAPTTERETVLAHMEEELQRHREQLQETIEQSEVSTEELRASNEELQAINEELRSATEELETSKEELQSVNEELVTVNYELKVKVEETSKFNDDLNNLIASTDIATIFVDRAMRIKRYTPRATDIFSIIATDIGRSLSDITHKLDYTELADDAISTLETLRPVEREVRQVNGRHYFVRFLPYRTTEDKIDGAVLTFFDITNLRKAEEQMHLSEERMRLVAESTRDYAIVTLNVAGFITSWNTGAERIFGYTEQEILGKHGDILFTQPDREKGAPEEERRRAREEGRAEDERWHVRKDGSTFYCSGIMTPLGEGAFHGYAKIARDQTERMTEHQTRMHALGEEHDGRERAELTSATKDEFLAVMSHELRHPLNLIHINIELLSRLPEIRRSPISVKAAGVIRNSVVSQAKIIDDLLDMSRLNTGKLTLTIANVDVATVVNDLVAAARADPATEALRITVRGCHSPVLVRADLVRTEQVIMNLLGNAIKFTAIGGIELALSRDGEYARLDVTDSGQGIAQDFLDHVFDMYGQGGFAPARSKGGLGIGLALVKQIAVLQGGRVAAASRGIGEGACFSVWFPLCVAATISNRHEPVTLENSLTGVRLLLVDDSEDIATSFQALLEMAGATTHIATSAREALDLLQSIEIDLLISDISMPDMDGYAFINEVRGLAQHAQVPSIAVSGLDRSQDVERCMQAGFNAHLGKPMPIEKLVGTIRQLLGPG
ncbi:MAG: hypothetical protein NVSMB6_28070 [Burkholderiaceae bacterium]